MSSAEGFVVPVATPSPAPPSELWRWVSTSNPLYVVSAGLFLLGLKMSFTSAAREVDSWALMGGLAGYTLLLAAAALVLVRFAGVWNDVRTVLLLVVLMFLATSVTFDELLVLDRTRGVKFYLGGLAFAVLITEGVLRGIRLRFPPLFRVPYHLALGLFFLYPVALSAVVSEPDGEALQWGLWGFAPAAGLVFLTLLPAVRRGAGYVSRNGSPWPWPYYPWSVFVFLAVAVCGRGFLLCWSFHLLPGSMQLVFGPYFLVPFGLAVAVLLLELGIVSSHRRTQIAALLAPVGLVALAGIGHRSDRVYVEFLGHFTARLGATPLFLTLLAACGFYLFAWVRGVKYAAEGLTAGIAGLAVVGSDSLRLNDAAVRSLVPLGAAVAVQLWVAFARRDVWRLAVCGLVPVCGLAVWLWRGYRGLREQVAGLDYIVIGVALLPVAVVVSLWRAGRLRRAAE